MRFVWKKSIHERIMIRYIIRIRENNEGRCIQTHVNHGFLIFHFFTRFLPRNFIHVFHPLRLLRKKALWTHEWTNWVGWLKRSMRGKRREVTLRSHHNDIITDYEIKLDLDYLLRQFCILLLNRSNLEISLLVSLFVICCYDTNDMVPWECGIRFIQMKCKTYLEYC